MELVNHKKAILVKGETKEYKTLLKLVGGKWNGTLQGWIIPNSKKESLLSVLKESKCEFTNSLTKEESKQVKVDGYIVVRHFGNQEPELFYCKTVEEAEKETEEEKGSRYFTSLKKLINDYTKEKEKEIQSESENSE